MNPTEGGPAGDTVLLADVGNSRIKLGVLADAGGAGCPPRVERRQDFPSRDFQPRHVVQWLAGAAPGAALLLVASVHDVAAARLEAAVAEISAGRQRPLRQRRVGRADLPVEVLVEEPDRVGIDRLAAAAAAALMTPARRGAIVVDCGTATTVDMISPRGQFLGGAILPGPALLSRALAEGTNRLPEVAALEHDPPPAMPGRSTRQAIAAGIGWGMRGAVTRLVAEARAVLGEEADLILSGGASGVVRDALPGAREVPDLVLIGIALAAVRGGDR